MKAGILKIKVASLKLQFDPTYIHHFIIIYVSDLKSDFYVLVSNHRGVLLWRHFRTHYLFNELINLLLCYWNFIDFIPFKTLRIGLIVLQ